MVSELSHLLNHTPELKAREDTDNSRTSTLIIQIRTHPVEKYWMKVHNLKKKIWKSWHHHVVQLLLCWQTTVIHTTGREGEGGGEQGAGGGEGGGGENQMLGVIHMQADIETALGEVLWKK